MIKTEYKGYDITYSEHNEEWRCQPLDITSKSLSRVKKRIDQIGLKMRKESAVECFEMTTPTVAGLGRTKLTNATIIEYGGTEPIKYGARKGRYNNFVYSAAMRSGSNRPARSRRNLDDMIRKEPGVMNKLGHIHVLEAQAHSLQEEIRNLRDDLPRVTIEDIQALIDISEGDKEDPAT